MYSAKKYPEHLSGEELDRYLYQGWYRLGQSVFTTQFLFFGSKVLNAIWIRLDLEGYQFSKSNKKILRTCSNAFEIAYQPLEITPEKEKLYKKYSKDFTGVLPQSLIESLQEEFSHNIFDSWEVTIRDKGKLIAYSVFDRGKTSIASIVGVYDPDYSKYSLGMATLLLEIQYGVANGYSWFYPGYIVPGNTRFDYKLRIGATQSYDLYTQHWVPTDLVLSEVLPYEQLEEQILLCAEAYTELGIPHKVVYNNLLEANFYKTEEMEFIDDPVFILTYSSNLRDRNLFAVTYDFSNGKFGLYLCAALDNFDPEFWHSLHAEETGNISPSVLFIRAKHVQHNQSPIFLRYYMFGDPFYKYLYL